MTGPQTSLAGPQTTLAGTQIALAGTQTPLAGPGIALAGPHTPLGAPKTTIIGLQTPSAGPQTPLDIWIDGWTDGWIDRIAPHPTGLCSLLGSNPATIRDITTSKKQGNGAADLIITLSNWFSHHFWDLINVFFMIQVPWISFAYCHLIY